MILKEILIFFFPPVYTNLAQSQTDVAARAS